MTPGALGPAVDMSNTPSVAVPPVPVDGAPAPAGPGGDITPMTPGTAVETPPPAQAIDKVGVVVVDQGVARCAPVCLLTLDVARDTDANPTDGWSYEGTDSCVIPGTRTALNQTCTTATPLPPPLQLPGVVIIDAPVPPAAAGVPRCAPLCRFTLSVTADTDETPADGWSYEDNASCVVPDSPTAGTNQPCTTGGALPDEDPRPGLLLADGLGSSCRPVCSVVTTPSDAAAAPDWGYELNNPCVLRGTPTAADRRACTYGGPPAVLTPPPLDAARKVAAGFFTRDGRLRDAYGNDFVIRGVNNPHIYFDTAARYEAYRALDRIKQLGANTIRVVWETTGPVALLEEVLHRVVELEMVPMLELHDATSATTADRLLDMAEYYARADVKAVLIRFREYALLNIANEWSGANGIYASAYRSAIDYLRNNGLSHTLVIDANGFGQNGQTILNEAQALIAADSQHNLLFSVHMYEAYGSANAVDATLNGADAQGIPLIVGEFGQTHNGRAVAWERILSRTNELGLGYVAWSWFGNGTNEAQLDMASDWDGALTAWGQSVMISAPGSIQSTAEPASVFE